MAAFFLECLYVARTSVTTFVQYLGLISKSMGSMQTASESNRSACALILIEEVCLSLAERPH